jgi:hypothetical protein
MPEARLLTKQKSLSACTYGLPLYVGGFVWKKIKMIAGDITQTGKMYQNDHKMY